MRHIFFDFSRADMAQVVSSCANCRCDFVGSGGWKETFWAPWKLAVDNDFISNSKHLRGRFGLGMELLELMIPHDFVERGAYCRVMEQSKNSSVQHNCVETNW